MEELPHSGVFLVVRTYFGDQAAWESLVSVIARGSEDEDYASVECVDDPMFDGWSVAALEAAHPGSGTGWATMYVADERALS